MLRRAGMRALHGVETVVYTTCAVIGTTHLILGAAHWYVANAIETRRTARAPTPPGGPEA